MNEFPFEMSKQDIPERELVIERLVQGELSDRQRSELVQAVEHWQDGWRDIARAFIEHQVIQQAFSANGSDTSHRWQTAVDTAPPVKKPEMLKSKKKKSGFNPWAMAACILVSLVGGLLIGSNLASSLIGPGSGNGSGTIVNAPHTDPQSDEDDSIVPVSQTVLRIPTSADGEAYEIPMTEVPSISQMWNDTFTPEMERELYRSGYRLVPSTQLVRGQTEDQREFVFPVHRISLESIAQ